MLHEFIDGFQLIGGFLIWLAGCLAAVVLGILVGAVIVAAVCWVFDLYTRWIAKRLKKKKRKPRNRLEKIILEHEGNAV